MGWPSEEAWALMDPNTSVTSMEFSRPENTFWELASVRLNYSDGETVFLENITHGTSFPMQDFKTIDFDESRPISAVKAGGNKYGAFALYFLDEEGEIIAEYDPKNKSTENHITYPIAENEEIIGVYGHKDTARTFKNFGFIVKEK